ncbi:unnamed protein product, partial [Closterium sp. Naga37s-1]
HGNHVSLPLIRRPPHGGGDSDWHVRNHAICKAGASGGGGREGANRRDGRELCFQCVSTAGKKGRATDGSMCTPPHRDTQPTGSDPAAAAVPGAQESHA